jgi:hypothetical protein
VRAVGTVRGVRRYEIPPLFANQPPEPVTRVALDIQLATDDHGARLDPTDYVGLEFEGPPYLADQLHPGDRIAITTTTPSGMHIAKIDHLS